MNTGRQALTDQEIIRDFTQHNQSTHKAEPSRSVGMAVLKLKNIYLGNATTEDDVKTFCELRCKEIAALLEDEKYAAYHPAIHFVLKKVEEGLDPNGFDTVTLFLPTENGTYEDVRYVFPLKEVISLVWRAIKDHPQYAHNYEGNSKQQLAQATEDYEERLSDFLHCLQLQNEDRICHHGNRNEPVCLLNDTYKGIHIIEDIRASILLYLKDKLVEQLLIKLNELDAESEERRLLISALITWMSESNAKPIADSLDPKKERIAVLRALCLEHGIDPDTFKLEEIIERALECLRFHCDPKTRPALVDAATLLQEVDMPQQVERNAALIIMQTWLKTRCQFNADDAHIIAYMHTTLCTHKNVLRHKNVLMVTGQVTEEQIDQLIAKITAYFKELQSGITKESVSAINLAELVSFNDQVESAKKNGLSDLIENFFVHFYSGNDADEKQYYGYLLDDNIAKKIILTDTDIKKFQSQEEAGFLNISPYMINRIFLHAILVLPDQWTDLFAKIFKETLEFVQSRFNQNADDHAVELMKASYPDVLCAQLRHLQYKREGVDPQRRLIPLTKIIHPANARTFAEWRCVFKMTAKSEWQNVCMAYLVSFRAAINLYLRSDQQSSVFDVIRWARDEGAYINWLVVFDKQQKQQLVKSIDRPWQIAYCLYVLPEESYQELADLLKDKLGKMLEKNANKCFSRSDNLPGKFRDTLLVHNGQGAWVLPASKICRWIEVLGPDIKDMIKSHLELHLLNMPLPAECFSLLIEKLGDRLGELILNFEELNSYLKWGAWYDAPNPETFDRDAKLMIALGEKAVQYLRRVHSKSDLFAWVECAGEFISSDSTFENKNEFWENMRRVFSNLDRPHMKELVQEIFRLQFDAINSKRFSIVSDFIGMRKHTLTVVLAEASELADTKPTYALLLLDVAYHHPLFSQSKNSTKAALISSVNSVFALFNQANKDGYRMESGFQTKLRQLAEEITSKYPAAYNGPN